MIRLALFFALLPALAFADDPTPPFPTAVVSGPSKANIGDLIILDASKSAGEAFSWAVDVTMANVPDKRDEVEAKALVERLRSLGFEVVEPPDDGPVTHAIRGEGRELFLCSYPGTYRVYLAAAASAEEPEGRVRVHLSQPFVIQVGSYVPPKPDPEPDPDDPDPVPPPPLDEFSTKVRSWCDFPDYDRDTALAIADNYEAVAAQANATGEWKLQDFAEATKVKNREVLGVEGVGDWGETFFKPLAVYQAELFGKRGLKVDDKDGISALWEETATAIRKGAP